MPAAVVNVLTLRSARSAPHDSQRTPSGHGTTRSLRQTTTDHDELRQNPSDLGVSTYRRLRAWSIGAADDVGAGRRSRRVVRSVQRYLADGKSHARAHDPGWSSPLGCRQRASTAPEAPQPRRVAPLRRPSSRITGGLAASGQSRMGLDARLTSGFEPLRCLPRARPSWPTTTAPAATTTAAPVTTTTTRPAPRPDPAPDPDPRSRPAGLLLLRPRLLPSRREDDGGGSVYCKNCDAVRAAGAAPIRRGDPGYASHLDGDGDGRGCAGD